MKKVQFLIISIIVLISCSDDNSLNDLEITGVFLHQIPNCDNSGNPEENCWEQVWFGDNMKATLSYGGSDYGVSVDVLRKGNKIEFVYESGIKAEVSFKIMNEDSLMRIEDNEVWDKLIE